MSTQGDCTEFGPFRLLPGERRLLRGETPVQIGARALDILIALVERPGEVVTKQELLSRVWPDVMVEESSLRVHIAALRKALADGIDGGRCIVNVTGRGYSFVASVTATTAAPPRSRPRAPPYRATRIIGREADIDTVSELLAEHRFITIHGAGGIGKTTLALALAHAQTHAAAHGVCFVDLSLSTGAHSAADALASALGLIVQASDPTASILDFIRDREMLLVLDSCEAMIAGAAALTESIVHEAAGVSVLATSREPLLARGEHIYPLAPLTTPPENTALIAAELLGFPAVQLFCERAAASGYRATLGDAEAFVIADICRKVEGNALAIELAAGRVSTYGLRQTAEMLASHLKLAWQGRRTAPARHQTLSAMLDWSYALINERERGVLRQLSVFVGPFVLEEARAVAGSGEDVADGLEQLVLKSLVAADTGQQPTSYRLLDTTRTYARAKLQQSGAAEETARRHAQYYLDWLTGAGHRAALPREHVSNIRAALDWAFSDAGDREIGATLAASACELLLRLGLLTESRRWSERALETLPPHLAGSRTDVTLRAALGHAMMFTAAHTDAVRDALERALEMAEQLKDPALQFRLISCLHMFHRRIGAVDDTLVIARRAETVAPLVGTAAAPIAAQAMLGVAHHIKGNLAEAYAALRVVRAASVESSTLPHFYGFHREADSLIGVNYWMRGFPDQAARAVRDAMPIEEDDPVTACLCLMWRIILHHMRGDWETTESHLEHVTRLASEHGLAPQKWVALGLKGDLQVQRGEIDEGIGKLREALRRLHEGRYAIFIPWLTCLLAEALAAHGDTEQALRLIDDVDPEAGQHTNVYMPEFLRVRGAVLAQAGDHAGAEQAFQRALDICDIQGGVSWRLRAATSLARLRLAQGSTQQARALLAGAYAQLTEGFETRDLRAARALLEEIDRRAVN